MNLSLFSKANQRVGALIGAALLSFLTVSYEAAASTGQSWVQPGSWSSNESGESNIKPVSTRKQVLSRESSYSRSSPFAPGSNNIAIDVGQVFLMGDLGKSYSNNIGMQAHYTYGVSDLFGFDSSLGYSSHSEGRYSKLTLLSGLRMNLAWYDKIIPHLVFGLGFYKPSYTLGGNGQPEATVSPVLFGVHIGPGIDLEMSRQFFFGASLTFHDMFGGERTLSTGETINVGGTYTSFLLRVGYTF